MPVVDLIALRVEMVATRDPASCSGGSADCAPLIEFEFQGDVHRRLDRGAADLAVALRGMHVADRKQRARDLDRQIELGSLADVAHVHVAADPAWRNDAVMAGLGGRNADRARHRPSGARARPARTSPASCRSDHSSSDGSPGRETGSASRPKPGILAVQPQPDGLNDSTVTFSASPGAAPSIADRPGHRIDTREIDFRHLRGDRVAW